MNSFIFRMPVTVYFGEHSVSKHLAEAMKGTGRNIMIAYGGGSVKKNGSLAEVRAILESEGKDITEFSGIMPNPTYRKVKEGAELAKKNHIDFILALGGGSVIDCCKVISAQAMTDEDLWKMEYEEGRMPSSFIPTGAIVTAFGTGAEMNSGAVITNEEKKMKSSLRGAPYSFAILDPLYTMTMPMRQVISGAFDSLSHCMESFMGLPEGDNLTDDINKACQRNIIRNIRATLLNPDDAKARSELMWAAAMAENGILILGKDNAFQAHMLEHQLGAYTDCNHGEGLAVIHPVLYRHMLSSSVEKFADLAVNVWDISPEGKSREELAETFISALSAFIKEIGLPSSFREMGIAADTDYKAIADSTIIVEGSSRKLSYEELLTILKECI